MLPLHAELTPEERDQILERVSQEVIRRRLEVPAVLALELHRPLTFLGSQALVLLTPLLGPAFGLANLQKLAALLEDRSNLDRLILRIEELAAEARRPGRGQEPQPTEPRKAGRRTDDA
jgi:hypothetical protein